MNMSTRIDAQAAAWISRLNADDRTTAVDAACREWLDADPRHRDAFEVANRMWESSATLPISLVARIGRPYSLTTEQARPPRNADRSRRTRWLVAASVAVTMLAATLLYTQRPQILATQTGQQLTLPLEDGSRLTLNTDTRIRVRFSKEARRIDLQSGEALFDVAKDPARPFIVRAGEREIRAFGTEFVVRYDAQQTTVTLVNGKVSVSEDVTSRTGENAQVPPATILHPGERVTIGPRHQKVVDRPALDTVTAWRKGEIVFENTPLSTAIEEMNRYSTRKLRLGAGAIAQIPVSGLFRSGDSENFALALTATQPLTAVELAGEIEIRAR